MELSTKRVLIMDWVEGERLDSVSSQTALKMVNNGVLCSMSQIFEHGFYHGDPHRGNLLATPDDKLAYIDFGMCGELPKETRTVLISAIVHFVNGEFSALANDFAKLGFLPEGSDRAKRRRISAALTRAIARNARGGLMSINFGKLSSDLTMNMHTIGFRYSCLSGI